MKFQSITQLFKCSRFELLKKLCKFSLSKREFATLRDEGNIDFKIFVRNQLDCDFSSFPLVPHNNSCEQNLSTRFVDNSVNANLFPSVSKILSTTMAPSSLAMLENWKKKKIQELGEEDFKLYQKNLLSNGRLLHRNIYKYLQNEDKENFVINSEIANYWKSLEKVLPMFSEVKFCESVISHPVLGYQGIVDCVAFFQDRLVLIEWKTSEKLKPSLKDLYDNPLQAVAYLGAINYSQKSVPLNDIILVYAYKNSSSAQLHHLNSAMCEVYWKKWLERLREYWSKVSNDLNSER